MTALQVSKERLLEIVERLPQGRVLVVGDAIIDSYHFGRVDRMCPEAPVPVFVTELVVERQGGAANVKAQLQALACLTRGHFLPRWSRTVKTRYMVGQHMIMRHDHDTGILEAPTQQSYKELAALLVDSYDVIVLSDYAKGWVTPQMAKMCIDSGIKVIVDPKGPSWAKYSGAYLICPNDREMFEAEQEAALIPNCLWKRGAAGMDLYTDLAKHHIPARAKHVYDVTGAGDTVVAVVAAAVAVGCSLLEAATLASIAAGYVVGEVGTAICSSAKLTELINEL